MKLINTKITLTEPLHREMKIICAKRMLTLKEYLEAVVTEAILTDKEKKK
jgi:hypothetical protein